MSVSFMNTLFGCNSDKWPHNEESLVLALQTRIQQERTKQEYYKVEQLNKTLELVKLAAQINVPPELIPVLVPERSGTLPAPNKADSNPMASFKFGAGSAQRKTTLNPRHQLSPSKIGAHAVSSLLNGKQPIDVNDVRRGRHHRTISLPPEVSIPEDSEHSSRKRHSSQQTFR
ncbi:hypothetical protein KL921_001950 [Ogataea angusta]|uniref:Uncharacterized protein n=1 Tax=Pichia angusta TaxID=870730 RepID=A0AAN6I6D5_PICAN|nr:uncharacterized protein KL928_002134 [Ogataea angusta]KAG7811684.1 hypothetical protein KL921_001950 [Ogataea angusta]KAG7819460.1 hypothetical protein KL928_002134 [Ogataea angusta]KAG7824240.1 hypothetical protein KL909_002238 [Ogataea angusta]KAG7861453.1 hypothetical protein KL919_002187 [Ogataea angusta]